MEKQLKDGAPSTTKVTVDEKDKFRAAATDGLALRLGMDVNKPAPGATDFRSLSLRELAKETLRMEGVNNAFRLSDEEMLRQYLNPTSTFTSIIDTTARKVFEQAYTEAETTYQNWTRKGTLKDFRPTKTYQTGTAGELKLVKEGGELEHDNPNGFEGAQRQLLTFGRQFTMTREAFINDDVGFLNTLPALYAQSARLGINKLVYKTLAENAAIYDGKKLFSNDHKNVSGVSGAPSIDTISAMRQLMRKQTAPGGTVKMNISPKYMIVPTSLETKAGQLIGSAVDPNGVHSAVQNPFFNSLTIISDAELDDATANGEKEWYLAADALRAAIQVDFLNGIDMPTIQMRQAPAGQLGFAWDIFIDYGVTVTDYRTLVKNNGQ
ncbi:Mu-like prophage major head subunit gpT family protein [Rummeliibacillus stabekisii]|uniref:phage major capsid protein n=1 Tax=Rummeliibacillus stabekisii TaxID=241244 RepID=UPI00191C6DDE|nr:Mu-like prophage major head subunit gpT family protein [Rummeliibacillus stabekisii]